jgi:hypothetical protein
MNWIAVTCLLLASRGTELSTWVHEYSIPNSGYLGVCFGIPTSDDGVIVVARVSTISYDTLEPQGTKYIILRISASGQVIMSQYESPESRIMFDVVESNRGYVLAFKEFPPSPPGITYARFHFQEIDSIGDVLSERGFPAGVTTSASPPHNPAHLANGNIVLPCPERTFQAIDCPFIPQISTILFQDYSREFEILHPSSARGSTAFIVVDSSGNPEWGTVLWRRLGEVQGAFEASGGGLILAGKVDPFGGNWNRMFLFLVRTDEHGRILASHVYDGTQDIEVTEIVESSMGDVLMLGRFDSHTGRMDRDLWFGVIDQEGQLIADTTFSGWETHTIDYPACLTPEGLVVIEDIDSSNIRLVCYNRNMEEAWSSLLEVNIGLIHAIVPACNGGYFLIGYSRDIVGDYREGFVNTQFIIYRLDETGEVYDDCDSELQI